LPNAEIHASPMVLAGRRPLFQVSYLAVGLPQRRRRSALRSAC
jgi:hypothetical protein